MYAEWRTNDMPQWLSVLCVTWPEQIDLQIFRGFFARSGMLHVQETHPSPTVVHSSDHVGDTAKPTSWSKQSIPKLTGTSQNKFFIGALQSKESYLHAFKSDMARCEADMARCERASAQVFFNPKICMTFKSLKLLDNSFIFCKYWDIVRSLASNWPHTCPMISWESVKTLSLLTLSSFAISSPTVSASYSTPLFKVLNLNLKICSITTTSGLAKIKPILFSFKFETPSTCNTQYESLIIFFGLSKVSF